VQRVFLIIVQYDKLSNTLIIKIEIMGKILYTLAIILLIAWAVGFLGFHVGGIIHVLLVIAIIAVLLRIISGKKVF
jgi:hypothetical protein